MLASPFSTRHHALLRELFALLGAEFSQDDPAANAATAKRLWLSEHRETIAEYTDQQLLGVWALGHRLGMLGESLPEPGQVAGRWIHNPGGTVRAMIKRFRLYQRLEQQGERPGVFVCWAGQRLRDLKLGETVPELVEFVLRENPSVLNDTWFKAELAKDDSDDTDRYERPFATETEIMILVAKVVYGDELVLEHIERMDEPSTIPGVPGRKALYYRYRTPHSEVIVLNGAAVRRYNGEGAEIEPRPTAASTAKEVAHIWGFDGVEGLMVSQPHSERLALDIDLTVRNLGQNPTFVVYGLPGKDVKTWREQVEQGRVILGEIARILTLEQQAAIAAV